MRNNGCRALVVLAMMSLASAAHAETVEIAPGVTVTRKTYPVPSNEAPFFNFAEKTGSQREADKDLLADILKLVPDPSKAAQAASGAGWKALITRGDYATAARRFNQAFLLDPKDSSAYQGFAAVAASRFQDVAFADELFRVAARMNSPQKTLNADHGRVLLMAGRPADAKPLLESAVRDDPDWAVPRSNLAMAVFQLGDAAEACRLLGQVAGRDIASVEHDIAVLKRQANCR